eukprot:SAG31_NODE_2426_length_5721_cov_11.664176_1_plen_409_part_00
MCARPSAHVPTMMAAAATAAGVAAVGSTDNANCSAPPALEHIRLQPFGTAALESVLEANQLLGVLDPRDCTHAEINPKSELASLVSTYVASSPTAQSFQLDLGPTSAAKRARVLTRQYPGDVSTKKARETVATIGLGLFEFTHQGQQLFLLHQTTGTPQGMLNGVDYHRMMVLIAPRKGQMHVLKHFCDELVSIEDTRDPSMVPVYWYKRRWIRRTVVAARPLETVVLPEHTTDRVIKDMDEFLAPETEQWYMNHGIPYKRSYLFHGVPGSGKTSLIQALASRYQRSICYVSPSEQEMTDEAFRDAMQELPPNAIVVLEDVDALFSQNRVNKMRNLLTFSGFLNALDGIGSHTGQVLVLTTNFREQLDPALIRSGRADVHIHFDHADDEQIAALCAHVSQFLHMSIVY